MSVNPPPSQMLRVPSVLVDAVKELSRLHRSGYTSAVVTGLQQLIASIDSTADSVASVAGGKSDTGLLAELISSIDERIAAQVAAQVAQLEERIKESQEASMQWYNKGFEVGGQRERAQWQSPLSPESARPLDESAIGEDAIAVYPEDMALGEIGEVSIADAGNTLEVNPAPAAASSEPVGESQQLTRKQLGELFGGISHETIRQWDKAGKLASLGWEPVPGTGDSPKNPLKYRSI